MEVISGKELAAEMKRQMAADIVKYSNKYVRVPNLVVILLGEDPASVSYVTNKARAAEEIGMKNSTIILSEQTTEEELLNLIKRLNDDSSVDGILVQLPLPRHIDENNVIETIAQNKDVDGLSPINVAALWQKRPGVLPCTPKGIIRLIKSKGIEISGKKAVVIGRSNIVGLPVSKLLLDENATVTITHSRTKNLAEICAEADILVPALGKPKFVKENMVKEGAVVIDVGINRDPETGKLCGDVDFERCAPKTSYITKVPGGVGPMTIACLLENTIECYLRNVQSL
jgi:methylenetetrahydrofolate dehydrogenase (NADP+)/methenyltetrahydrofolate cyclohydrolase